MPHYQLKRRGFLLGNVHIKSNTEHHNAIVDRWNAGNPIFLEGMIGEQLGDFKANLRQSFRLYTEVLQHGECVNLVSQEPYHSRLRDSFAAMGGAFNEGDDQEIETLFFDAIKGDKTLAEDLWMKISWLSFFDQDESLRFRFSFGTDFAEDVAKDPLRQHCAAKLTEVIFPESTLLSENQRLCTTLCEILDSDAVSFVERIIYFNAPQGGAYFHHDRERGHAGVVYAQLTGGTYWLALPISELAAELDVFIEQCETSESWPNSLTSSMRQEMIAMRKQGIAEITRQLETFNNSTLIHLANETEAFTQRLIQHGHGQLLEAGDVLLLPQKANNNCCWHSVFNIGDEAGEALSFAIR